MAVVAIVVILASLLVAGLERAIYEADLAVCQANEKNIGLAVLTYSVSNRRTYPHRPGVHGDRQFAPVVLSDNEYDASLSGDVASIYDDRPMLRYFLPINESLNCPMVRSVNLEDTSNSRTRIYASQALWFGWQYYPVNGRAERGMNRVGDRFTWGDHSFAILASDWTAFSREDNWALGSHPDYYDGIMTLETAENHPLWIGPLDPATYSFWVAPETSDPGPVDRTFLYDDGSVRRLSHVVWRLSHEPPALLPTRKEQVWKRADDRMVRVPERAREDPTRSTHLPKY
ncbi:MAG TPA: hypothetical protein VM754_11590 [Actinomycetota bacterium]|nr:hypothetical protein [Actinomycetota bacterium]